MNDHGYRRPRAGRSFTLALALLIATLPLVSSFNDKAKAATTADLPEVSGYAPDFANGAIKGVGYSFTNAATGLSVDIRLKGVSGVGAIKQGAGYTYLINSGTKVVYEPSRDRIKESIVTNNTKKTEYRFKLTADLYITDYGNRRIRKIDGDGIISTVAGNGSSSATGDGGPATSASIGCPIGLEISSSNEILFTDDCNQVVRKISSAGIITTIAGTGVLGYSGDGGPAIAAQLKYPEDVAVDAAGNVYISDTSNSRVRKIDLNGMINTVAGTGSPGNATGDGGPATLARISNPHGIDVDAAGNLYIATDDRVRRVDQAGIITTIAGDGSSSNIAAAATEGGPATLQSLDEPRDIEVSVDGTVYIAEYFGCKVRKAKFDRLLGQYRMRTIAGTGVCGYSGDSGSPSEFALNNPSGLAISDEGDLFVVDSGNLRVLRLSLL